LAGAEAADATGVVEPAVADVPGAEVAAGPAAAVDCAAGDSAATEPKDAAGADAGPDA
jgi:hypothetical protein